MTPFRAIRLSLFSEIACILCSAVVMAGCNGEKGVDGETPKSVSDFIYLYFPLDDVETTTRLQDGGWQVRIHNSATVTFDSSGSWTDINGNGNTLPAQLVFDEFPSTLYSYIESGENQNNVYSVSRNSNMCRVLLLDNVVIYSITTGKITEE